MTSTYGITLMMRAVLAATFVSGAFVALVDCGASSDETSAFGGGDGGMGFDGGGDAAGSDGESVDAGIAPGTTLLVHASPDLFDFRVCFGASATPNGASVTFDDHAPWPSDDSHPMAMSNYAAIAVGGGAAIPRELLTRGGFVIPYLINASRIATDAKPETVCGERVGPACSGSHCFIAGTDYVQLPGIAASELEYGGTHVLAIVGCKTATGAACGVEMGGALHGAVLGVSGQGQQAVDQVGVQLAHVAPAAGSIVATFDDTLNDAGPIAVNYLDVGPSQGVILNRPSDAGSALWGTDGVTIGASSDGGVALRMSLADVQRVSDPSLLPSDFFTSGGSYVFVLVGDPNAANALYADGGINPKFDGTALHVVAVSTAIPSPLDGGI